MTTYKCPECGSVECEITAWVKANGEVVVSTWNEGPNDEAWCPSCEKHFSYKSLLEVEEDDEPREDGIKISDIERVNEETERRESEVAWLDAVQHDARQAALELAGEAVTSPEKHAWYGIEERELARLGAAATRLLSMDKLTGDQMRDLGKVVQGVVDLTKQFDLEGYVHEEKKR